MGSGGMALYILWSVLIAAALIFLIRPAGARSRTLGSHLGLGWRGDPFIHKRHRLRAAHITRFQALHSESSVLEDGPIKMAAPGDSFPYWRQSMLPPAHLFIRAPDRVSTSSKCPVGLRICRISASAADISGIVAQRPGRVSMLWAFQRN